jgi:protein subunit release factor B
VVRLELAGAVLGSDQAAAMIRVVPIGGADEWADSLLQMYVSWAAHSGRESELVSDREARIAGLSSYDLLKSEAGLHRQLLNDDEFLARVQVVTDESAGDPAHDVVADEVVRVYSEGKNQFVRDPRTGVRIGDVGSVFRGRIDEFLVSEATRQP